MSSISDPADITGCLSTSDKRSTPINTGIAAISADQKDNLKNAILEGRRQMRATSIGYIVRAIRKGHGLTTVEMGQRLGVQNGTISRYENDKVSPSFGVLLQLSDMASNEQQRAVLLESVPRQFTTLRVDSDVAAPQKTSAEQMTAAEVEKLFTAKMDVPGRDPRSRPYREGVRDLLRRRFLGTEMNRAGFKAGSVEFDAYYAGVDEGWAIYREWCEMAKQHSDSEQ